jgi:hypothetical protein
MHLLSCIAVTAQSTGKLRLIVDPGGDFEFVLDRQYRMKQREVELGAGAHHFSIWAPARRIVDTTITVEADRMKDFFIRLPYSPEYVAYSKQLNSWQRKRNLERRIPALATFAGLIWTSLSYAKVKDAHDQLEADRADYEDNVTPADIAYLKDVTMPLHKDDFRKAQSTFHVAAGITVACAGATYYLFKRSARAQRPVFNDTEKVRFDGLVWVPGVDGGQWLTQLTIPLAR